MMLQPWFKPRVVVDVNGATWVSDGHVALRAEHDGEGLQRITGEPFASVFASTQPAPSPVAPGANGRSLCGGRVFATHLLALCETAHPGVAWHHDTTPEGDGPHVVGYVGGVPVAVVMGRRERNADTRVEDVAPPCPVCEGAGSVECEDCEGSGRMDCHACEQDTECDGCDGEGTMGPCPACAGTGFWKAPEPT